MTLLPEFGGPGRQELLQWPRWGPNVSKAGSCASPLHVGPEQEAQAISYRWPQPWLHLAHQEPPRDRGLAPRGSLAFTLHAGSFFGPELL